MLSARSLCYSVILAHAVASLYFSGIEQYQ
jgi:hypothetical protein